MWLVLWLFLCSFLSPSLNFNHVQNTPTNKIFRKALEWYPAIKQGVTRSRFLGSWCERGGHNWVMTRFSRFFPLFPQYCKRLSAYPSLSFRAPFLMPRYVCYYKALDSSTRTTTRTTFIFKFSRLFSKNRHPGESIIILYLFFHRKR